MKSSSIGSPLSLRLLPGAAKLIGSLLSVLLLLGAAKAGHAAEAAAPCAPVRPVALEQPSERAKRRSVLPLRPHRGGARQPALVANSR